MSSPTTVLVTFHNGNIAQLVQQVLLDAGAMVTTVPNPGIALALVGVQKQDVLMTNWRNPNLDMADFIAQAKLASRDTRIIVLTGGDADHIRAEAMRAGADDVIGEPVDIDSIVRAANIQRLKL